MVDALAIATALRILRGRLAELNSERMGHELTIRDIRTLERVEVGDG